MKLKQTSAWLVLASVIGATLGIGKDKSYWLGLVVGMSIGLWTYEFIDEWVRYKAKKETKEPPKKFPLFIVSNDEREMH